MTLHRSLLLVSVALAVLVVPRIAAAACGAGTPFPQCDDTCPPGQVCASLGGGCGCVAPTAACSDPGNPNGPPVCYGSCPPSQPICATLAGGCACIPTLSEWGVIAMTLVMLGAVLLQRRGVGARR